MKGIVYKYTNRINNKSYIGSTLHEEERKEAHFRAPANSQFHKALKYYGWINFDYEVLERDIDESELRDAELQYITLYDSFHNGYNQTLKSCIDALENKIKLKKEGYHCSNLPYGYEHRNHDGKVYINEEQANIIIKIYNDYSTGEISTRDIDKKYNQYMKKASGLLRTNRYIGNGIYPPIINKELYDKVQIILKNGKHKRKNNNIEIDGVKYKSMTEASEKLHLNRHTIKKRYNVIYHNKE